MALWFTASAVGPQVTPWERRAKTYERFISSPFRYGPSSPVSPLSYARDLTRPGFGQAPYFPPWLSLVALAAFTASLFWGACRFHGRWRAKRL